MSNKPNPTDVMRQQQKPLEQLDAEHANDSPLPSIPVNWTDGAGTKLKGRSLVVVPSDGEIEAFSAARAATCGQCKNYDLEGGRKEIIKQRLGERLVHEEQWQLHHMGDIESLGVCRENPRMAVSYITKATDCPSFRPRKTKR